ncbi:NUCLEAR FUSION DEFECTIVE 4-like [Olea europaea subsp. europaea]|uniref:NUCLEAR FUSION DEFECTIVE 4-like n=1 Tax=Olea europaea subsp. europaea TaxID=158383 RepID=A0A8S0TBP0_OLEEU|nr:NUCLEAR FUSION DEFECTIVE 4-like [Olea europaea subsp. europaea]
MGLRQKLIILRNAINFSPWVYTLTLVVLLVLLASPIKLAIKANKEDLERSSQTFLNTSLIKGFISFNSEKSTVENLEDCGEIPSDTICHKPTSEDTLYVEEMNLFPAMRTMNFWLLFVAMLCGMGSGMATINNISQIGESLGYTSVQRSTLVSLWSMWNFLGRFGAGYVSDIFLHRRGWARPLFNILTLATMAAGHTIIGLGFPGNLYLGSVLIGVCYGSQWSLMPAITSEIFGVLHMGTIFYTIAVASPVGSYIFSVRVIGYIYDKESSGKGNLCSGSHCFRISFFILAGVSLFGSLVALVLFIKTRRLYKVVVLRRLQNSRRG